MNAVMREQYEEPVAANEDSIGVLRTGLADVKEEVRGMQTDIRSLRDRVDRNYETLSGKIDRNHETLSAKHDALWHKIDDTRSEVLGRVEQVRTELPEKIEKVNSTLRTGIDQLHAMLSQTNIEIAGIKSLHKTVLWVVSVIVSLAGLLEMGIRLGKTLGWF